MKSVQYLINLLSSMQTLEEFAIYRTPFKLKFKLQSKKTPTKQSSKQPCKNYQSARNNINIFTKSPYSIKYARNHQSAKTSRKAAEKEPNNEDRFASEMRQIFNNTPNRQNKFEEIVEKQKNEQIPVDLSKSQCLKVKTLRQNFVRSASRKKYNIQRQMFESKQSRCRRKFTTYVVNLDKQDQKNHRKIDKKLQNYNYKKVLGDILPFHIKKLPKLMISQHGVVKFQRS